MAERRWANRIVGHGEVDPRTLLGHPRNPKVHPAEQDTVVGASLDALDWLLPVTVNKTTGHVLNGHERITLAIRHGEAVVPVDYVELPEALEGTALMLLDQSAALALPHLGRWAELRAEAEQQTTEPALLEFWAQFAAQQGLEQGTSLGERREIEEADIPADQVDEAVERWQVVPGDLWACGTHRVGCGDCREPEVLARLLGGTQPTIVIADPPYGIDIVQANGYVGNGEAYQIPFGGVKTSRGTRTPVGKAKPPAKYAPVIGDDSTATAIQVSTYCLATYPGAVQVWWGGNYYANALPASAGWLVWDKETNGNFADCELAWTNQARAARLFTHRWNGMLRASEHGRRWHPTQKPVALMAWVLETVGNRHGPDTILDPFLGSGPVLLAAEQRGHTCFACDLSPGCCSVVLERWHRLTGQQPERLS